MVKSSPARGGRGRQPPPPTIMNTLQLIEAIEADPRTWKFYRTRAGNITVDKQGKGYHVPKGTNEVITVNRVTAHTSLRPITLKQYKDEI